MKKHLLLGSALLAAISAYPQNGKLFKGKASGAVNVAEEFKKRFNSPDETAPLNRSTTPQNQITPSQENTVNTNAKSSAAVTVTKISSSMNIYGVLVSQVKPLQWNDNVDAVSFIHRGSPTYVAVGANATGKSGNIVADLSTNMGTTWDSTCVWVNNTNLARYPQGGLYSAPGNTSYNNTYIVSTGPNTNGSNWIGNFYASKSVTATPKNQPGTDQQFFPNTAVVGQVGRHDFSRLSFASTDDGIIHSIGGLYNDVNLTAGDGYRGAQVVKGSFNAGAFVWATDSIIPPVITESGGDKSLHSAQYMAWNEQGTVGYVMFLGRRTGATGSNVGWQPIVYKTTNSGASWAILNGLDFNSPALQFVKDRIGSVTTNTNLEVPFFNISEGIDMVVDAAGNLHIGSLVNTSFSAHPDSASFSTVFGANQTRYIYSVGGWPYVYDFTTNGAGWKTYTIDSLPTEVPGFDPAQPSFSVNPWTTDANGQKVQSSNRLQLSRSVTGDRIAFVWTQSDTTLTAHKFNQFPDLKARLICAVNGTISIAPVSTSITSTLPPSAVNNRVKNKAYFHCVSPKMKYNLGGNLFELPITVSNSPGTDQLSTNDHFFIKAEIANFACLTAINETAKNTISNNALIPNPAKGNVNVKVVLANTNTIDVAIYNLVGQLVKTAKAEGQVGDNIINVNLDGLNAGIYMVKVSTNGKTSTQKLVVE
jgi:hypothetical protein